MSHTVVRDAQSLVKVLEPDELFGFSELEERLLGPDGPETLQLCLTNVVAIGADMTLLTKQGLTQDDYAVATALIEATAAAERILKHNPRPQGVMP